MSRDNPISTGVQWWKQHGLNPLGTAALLGAIVYGKNRAMWGPSVELLRSLGRPIGSRVLGSDDEWNASMDRLRDDSSYKTWLPMALGLMAAGGAAGLMYRPGEEAGGLLEWDAKSKPMRTVKYVDPNVRLMGKTASYLTDSYVQDLDWAKPVDSRVAKALFTNDPRVQNDAYARNMGLSIVNSAVNASGSLHPSLGNVFDSALDKFEKKVTWSGMADVAVKSAVANTAARLFTGALGAVCGMGDKTRQALVDAGTWAGAITSILD